MKSLLSRGGHFEVFYLKKMRYSIIINFQFCKNNSQIIESTLLTFCVGDTGRSGPTDSIFTTHLWLIEKLLFYPLWGMYLKGWTDVFETLCEKLE